MKPRLYISGPYTGATPYQTDLNIHCARKRMMEAMITEGLIPNPAQYDQEFTLRRRGP